MKNGDAIPGVAGYQPAASKLTKRIKCGFTLTARQITLKNQADKLFGRIALQL